MSAPLASDTKERLRELRLHLATRRHQAQAAFAMAKGRSIERLSEEALA